MNRREVERAVDKGVLGLLRDRGFRANRAQEVIWRGFPGGMHQVSFPVFMTAAGAEVSLVAGVRLDAVEEIVNEFTGTVEAYKAWTSSSLTRLEFFTGGHPGSWVISDLAGVDGVVSEMGSILFERILPFMEELSTVEAFDRAMNRESVEFDITSQPSHSMIALTVARLAANPDYERLRASHSARLGPQFDPGLRDQFDRLVAHLDQLGP